METKAGGYFGWNRETPPHTPVTPSHTPDVDTHTLTHNSAHYDVSVQFRTHL